MYAARCLLDAGAEAVVRRCLPFILKAFSSVLVVYFPRSGFTSMISAAAVLHGVVVRSVALKVR